MAVFRVERRIKDYTVMSNHHLRNKNLSLEGQGPAVADAFPAGRLGLHPQRACRHQ